MHKQIYESCENIKTSVYRISESFAKFYRIAVFVLGREIDTPSDHLVERNSGDFLYNSGEEREAVGGVEILATRL